MSAADDRELVELYLQVARGLAAQLYEIAVRHDLTPVQALTLRHLADGGVATKEIAARLCCDPSNATGIVDQLERRGLVRRTTPPDDRRKRIVESTDEGRAVVSGLRAALASTATRFDRLSPGDRTELRRMLEVLAAPG